MIVSGDAGGTVRVWGAASDFQAALWQQEEDAAGQRLHRLADERAAEEEASRSEDQGTIRHWLILAPIPLQKGETGNQGLRREQIPNEAMLKPRAGDRIPLGGESSIVPTRDSVVCFYYER